MWCASRRRCGPRSPSPPRAGSRDPIRGDGHRQGGTARVDSEPAIISDDYFDERIVEGTELAQPEDTTRENILAEAGYEQIYDIDEVITRMPTPVEAERLGIATGTPVAEHIRTGYTAADQAVRVMVSIIPGDTLILQYTIPT